MSDVVIGIDGGNSKTDVAVAELNGRIRAVVRGAGSSPDKLGDSAALAVLTALVERGLQEARRSECDIRAMATLLAGLDLPEDAPRFERALVARYPGVSTSVDNDTMAVLMAGTGGEPGIAVVCGAGINAVGMSVTGDRVGFLSLGQISGDWGGGLGLGREVLWHAVRAEDGRGQPTALRLLVQEHFGCDSVTDVVLGLHRGEIGSSALAHLVPLLVEADRDHDPVATALTDRLVEEIRMMITVLLQRTGLRSLAVPVVLAGGILTTPGSRVSAEVIDGLQREAPRARAITLESRPVAGAVLGALLASGADPITPAVASTVLQALELRDRSAGAPVSATSRTSGP